MAVSSEVYDGVAVVGVEGELADEQATGMRDAFAQLVDSRKLSDYVIDLTACTGVASDGLEAMLWAKSRCEELYGRLKLAVSDPTLMKVLEMTRLRRRFECCDSLETALKLMRA